MQWFDCLISCLAGQGYNCKEKKSHTSKNQEDVFEKSEIGFWPFWLMSAFMVPTCGFFSKWFDDKKIIFFFSFEWKKLLPFCIGYNTAQASSVQSGPFRGRNKNYTTFLCIAFPAVLTAWVIEIFTVTVNEYIVTVKWTLKARFVLSVFILIR